MSQFLFGDSPWLADIVYPMLAGVCTMVMFLSLAWYRLPPRPRHPLHLYIAAISGTLIIPALLASAATGNTPTIDVASVRNTLRLAWLLVGCSLLSVVVYYIRRFLAVWLAPHEQWSERLQRWIPKCERDINAVR